MRAFLIENGTAVQKAAPGCTAEDMGMGWVDGPDDVVCGYVYDGQDFAPPEPDPTPEGVNAERDRRLKLDFEFQGVTFQRDQTSVRRISGASTQALGAMMNGAQPGDLHWHGDPASPFGWIASDNSVVTMDAQTMFAFGQAAASVESRLVFAAKTLREMSPIPDDFAADAYWQ